MNAPVSVQQKAHASRIQRVVSPAGVEAWLVEDYTVPLVAVEFSMRGGASQDPADKAGLAYFLSACSTRVPDPTPRKHSTSGWTSSQSSCASTRIATPCQAICARW